jgi:hypothetical protein
VGGRRIESDELIDGKTDRFAVHDFGKQCPSSDLIGTFARAARLRYQVGNLLVGGNV